jgi:tetratricopeptide (TPR) repeat protein
MISTRKRVWGGLVGWMLGIIIVCSLLQPKVLFAQSSPDCDNLSPAECSNAYIASGRELYLAGSYRAANRAFTEAIALAPDSLNAWLWRGAGLWAIEAYAAAYADLDSALQLDYDLAWTYHLAGRPLLDRQIDLFRYVARYRLAVADDPALAAAYANRWELYKRFNDIGNPASHPMIDAMWKARSQLNRAIDAEPINPRLRYQVGILMNALGDYDRANQALGDALILDPDFVDAYRLRADNSIQLNQQAKALEDYSKAIDRSPDDADLHMRRASLYSLFGDSEAAAADFNTALTLEPDNALIYFARAFSHWGYPEPDYEASIEDFNIAIQIDPGFAPAYLLRGASLLVLNRVDEALQDLWRAEALGMNEAPLYMALGNAYDRVGNYTAAADYLRRYVALVENPSQSMLNRIAELEAQGY